MTNLISMIIEADVLGVDASLYARKGSKQNKNLFGGIISILMTTLIFGGSIFFVSQFFDRSQLSLISNFEEDPNVSVKNFNKLPLMVRLSGNLNALIPDNFYKVSFLALTFDESQGSAQTSFPVNMQKCNIENNFGDKKDLFKDIKDIESYYCPVWDREFDLRGIYGSTNYTYGIMFFSPCVESSDCADRKSVYSSLSGSYLDYITLTNSIQHYSSDPHKEALFKGRIAVSSSIYKRVWIYFEKIIYITDFGYIFEEKSEKVFNNVKEYSVDVDLRNVTDTNFLWVTFLNYSSTTSFIRSYMKAQALLANIGGIIKGLSICGMIITFPIAYNLSNQDIINSVYDKNSSYNIKNLDRSPYSNKAKNIVNYDNNNTERKRSNYKVINSDLGGMKISENSTKNTRENPKNSFDCCKSLTDNNLVTYPNNELNNLQHLNDENKIIESRSTKFNNYTNKINKKNEKEEFFNIKKLTFTKSYFKFNLINLLDPFQICLKDEQKVIYNERLNKAYRLLNRDNLLASIQEFNSLKGIVLDETQLDYFENLYKYESNTSILSRNFNTLCKVNDKNEYNGKLVSLLVSQ